MLRFENPSDRIKRSDGKNLSGYYFLAIFIAQTCIINYLCPQRTQRKTNTPKTMKNYFTVIFSLLLACNGLLAQDAHSSSTSAILKNGISTHDLSERVQTPEVKIDGKTSNAPSSEYNVMQILDAYFWPGAHVYINLAIFNNQEFVAFQLDVPLPGGFSYIAGSVALNPERAADHLIMANVLPGTNIFRMISFSLTNAAYTGNEGIIATFILDTPPGVTGSYTLPIENGIMATIEGNNILDYTLPGVVQIGPCVSFTVTFVIQDVDGNAITDAVVTLGSTTNPAGNYVFPDNFPGVYDFSVTAPGYETFYSTVEVVEEDVTVTVTLVAQEPPAEFTVAFVVQDADNNPIANAIITLGDITNEPGNYIFENIPEGIYNYTIIAEGYETTTGTVEIIEDLTITIVMGPIVYTILATAGEGGYIEPSGLIIVQHGSNQSFMIVPSEGYHIDDVLVDGQSAGPVQQYEFTNITGNHSIDASFTINIYSIMAEPNNPEWGSIIGAGLYEHGQTVTLTATAAPDYEFIMWQEDGLVVSTDEEYVFTATADRSLIAIFDFVDGVSGLDGSALQISVYPNPAHDIVSIALESDRQTIESIRIFDLRGKEVIHLLNPEKAADYHLNLGRLAPGTYVLQIATPDGMANKRLIVI
jgi:hypothetical protein